jgi:hypothetical protein
LGVIETEEDSEDEMVDDQVLVEEMVDLRNSETEDLTDQLHYTKLCVLIAEKDVKFLSDQMVKSQCSVMNVLVEKRSLRWGDEIVDDQVSIIDLKSETSVDLLINHDQNDLTTHDLIDELMT